MAEHLIGTAANPLPENVTAGFFDAGDGRKIRYARFDTPRHPRRGTVIILQGRNECIEKYFETAADLGSRGLSSATFDLRGQGGSDRLIGGSRRGHVDSFSEYVSDLDVFVDTIVLPDCPAPYFILAHSTGALVALLAIPSMINRIDRLVLCAPLLALYGTNFSTSGIAFASGLLNGLGMGRFSSAIGSSSSARNRFQNNKLTSDIRRYERNVEIFRQAPRLALGAPTIAWIDAFSRASATVRQAEFIKKIRIPVMIIAAGRDQVVSNKAIEEYALRLRAGSLLTIDSARHEILQEADIYREQFFAAFDAFVPGTSLLV